MSINRPRPSSLARFGLAVALAALLVPQTHGLQQPFQPVETARVVQKRQGSGCLENFYSCAQYGAAFNGVCCQNGQTCRLDTNNNPACCPRNAICTGVAPANFQPPNPTIDFVPNPYYSFPYIATSFGNARACSQAIGQCSDSFQACTSQLGGQAGVGNYHVTVVVPGGGGTTVTGNGGINYGPASATSICSSLSRIACRDIQPGMCTMTGAAGGFYVGTAMAGNVAARPTLACAVAAVGIAGLGLV
ncbi:hypothetical protein B0T18DRAFT_398445 [Schizothecium vesticola]|uniref:Gpi-anchored protein n=1 Tax=Schizothecium vesticola TaxID=314040 RepID=A0AA40FA64_9PEZI|nr:hypothetical protein B0T18DRAFT_398445 [Schizothecium vesticola]